MTNDTQSGEVARLRAAYLAGFNASGEGYNGEYPFSDRNQNPSENAKWCEQRDYDLLSVIDPQPTGRTDSELVAAMNLPPSVGWQVHVIGPDDIHKCSSYDEAIQEARGINVISAKFNAEHPGQEVLCLAYVRPIWIDGAMDSEKEAE